MKSGLLLIKHSYLGVLKAYRRFSFVDKLDHDLNDSGIKLCSRTALKLVLDPAAVLALLIVPASRHGIVAVGNADYTGEVGYILAL